MAYHEDGAALSMDNDKLTDKPMRVFLGELEHQVHTLQRGLLAFDGAEGRTEVLTTLFRSVHSLKGAGRSVSLGLVEAVCHRLESMLVAARDGHHALTPERLQVLNAAADALVDAGRRLRQKEELAGGPLDALLPRIDAILWPA